MTSDTISKRIESYIQSYLVMDLGPIKINCPYWMNKLKKGKVVIRGKFNGKGESHQIRFELKEALDNSKIGREVTPEFVYKLARRERIGIDCSGLTYRILEDLIYSGINKKVNSLDQIFPGGIHKTNVRRLTSSKSTYRVKKTSDIKPTDLIRMMGGKHMLLVIENNGQYIHYIHSSNRSTREKGVHIGKIKIIAPDGNLDKQEWLEKTPRGENFGKKYFNPKKGDSARRLKFLL